MTDLTPYADVLSEMRGASPSGEGRFVSFFERSEPSALSRNMVALLCTGKYKTLWRGAPLMKDALSWVLYASMLQEIKPRTIFDLGTAGGGSALWLSDLCRALDLDATVVTVDIEDLRDPEIRRLMEENPKIVSLTGDLQAPMTVLSRELLSSLAHPWLIIEDAHVPTLPILSHFHLYGGREGDYFVCEDTHPEGPNVSGMGAHDMEGYETGFGAEKTRSLALAMCVFGKEYQIDTKYADMFGHEASFMPRSILRRVTPEETARILDVESYEGLTQADVDEALEKDGHVLLRPKEPVVDMPYSTLPSLLRIERPNLYEQGSEARARVEGSRYLEVTRFPPDQAIPPHHELFYTPNPPERVAFVCLEPPGEGGETSIFDGRRALGFLPEQIRERIGKERVRWRRTLGPPTERRGLENATWSSTFGAKSFEEALERARDKGYSVAQTDTVAQTMTLDCLVWMHTGGALATSVAGNHPWIYEVFYPGTRSAHDQIVWENGDALTEEEVYCILEAYVRARVHVRWTRRGEVLVLDNKRFAHGRQPWAAGPRAIAVLMGDR